MISTLPPILSGKISSRNPSGYCGASRSIRHKGTNKTATKASPHSASKNLTQGFNLSVFILQIDDIIENIIKKEQAFL